MKSISSETKSIIINKLRDGVSVKDVAKHCGVSVGTVSKYKNIHLPNLPKGNPGRKSIFTSHEKGILKRKFMNGQLRTGK
jgi:transposase